MLKEYCLERFLCTAPVFVELRDVEESTHVSHIGEEIGTRETEKIVAIAALHKGSKQRET